MPMRDRCGCGCGRWEAAADNAEAAAGSTTADVVVTVTRGAKSLPALRACVGGSCRAAGSSCTARGARAGPVYSNALRAALLWGAAPTARAPRLAWNKEGDETATRSGYVEHRIVAVWRQRHHRRDEQGRCMCLANAAADSRDPL